MKPVTKAIINKVITFFPPIKTKKECSNPAFMSKLYHRVGLCKVKYHDDGLKGYSCIKKCVMCGRRFDSGFLPSNKNIKEIKVGVL
tara:strand:+ start:1760 stop:2017 length:258 start_codon:yes stop_codon:yes gene_type:complete